MLNVHHFIEKMEKSSYCLGVNFLLMIGVFLCALLGRSLGIQGPALAISIVWPATGLSLAALLLFGYRAGVGIFLGIFTYTFLFLIIHSATADKTLLDRAGLATLITMGSLTQALISAYIIRTYSTPLIFRTVQDVFIFLIPASLLSCLIGSTVGVATLTLTGGLDKNMILPSWLTFWLGDTVGIYVVTPLIIIWTLLPREVRFSDHIPSIVSMIFLFVVFSFASYWFEYPLLHLFIPISIWAAYLFRMHGASLAIFLMTAASIAFAVFHGYEGTSLTSLITFIAVTSAASLIIAAVVNERAQAWALLDSRNLYLEKEVDVKVEVLEQVRREASKIRKFSSISSVTQSMKQQVHPHLSQIERITKSSQEALEDIQKHLIEHQQLTPDHKKVFSEKLHQIRKGLSGIIDVRKRIAEILESLGLGQD